MNKILILFFVVLTDLGAYAQTSITSSHVQKATVCTAYTSPLTAVISTNNPITFTTVSTLFYSHYSIKFQS
jgi:hypothetical protein